MLPGPPAEAGSFASEGFFRKNSASRHLIIDFRTGWGHLLSALYPPAPESPLPFGALPPTLSVCLVERDSGALSFWRSLDLPPSVVVLEADPQSDVRDLAETLGQVLRTIRRTWLHLEHVLFFMAATGPLTYIAAGSATPVPSAEFQVFASILSLAGSLFERVRERTTVGFALEAPPANEAVDDRIGELLGCVPVRFRSTAVVAVNRRRVWYSSYVSRPPVPSSPTLEVR